MQANTVQKRLESLASLSKAGKRMNGLTRLLTSRVMMDNSVNRTRGNHGSATPGIDGKSLNGLTTETINVWVHDMAQGIFRAKPVKRVYIPKTNGKLRPLGIPVYADRMVQRGQMEILQRIYEPIFSMRSYGFRPGRSCHTALAQIQHYWTATKWFIEVDIKGYFDNIDHEILLNLLRKRIDDETFIGTIRAQLQAGVMKPLVKAGGKRSRQRLQYQPTYSGTPQGGMVSPILANIYLHELDEFVEAEIATFNGGTTRRINLAYGRVAGAIRQLRLKVKRLDEDGKTDTPERDQLITRVKELTQTMRSMPSRDPMDPNYRRLTYLRYADDFILGVIGSKADAIAVLEKIRAFLKDTLKLDVSEEKTGIVKATDGARFLGYDIRTKNGVRISKLQKEGFVATKRTSAERIILSMPDSKLEAFCNQHGYGDYRLAKGQHRTILLNSSDYEAVNIYNAELRGFANYYRLDIRVKSRISQLVWVWQQSLMRTLANRHKTRVSRVLRRLREPGKGYVVRHVKGDKTLEIAVWRPKDLTDIGKASPYPDIDRVPLGSLLATARTDVTDRMLATECENVLCTSPSGTPIQVHHVNALANVRTSDRIEWMKAARIRKTRYLCADCHPLVRSNARQKGVKYSKGEPDAVKAASPVLREGASQSNHPIGSIPQSR